MAIEFDEILKTCSWREREIVSLLALGYRDRDVTEQLQCSRGLVIRCKVRLRKALQGYFRKEDVRP